ncbi:MAG TPA: site-2 protease family protein [Armatimonadota bacterium]|jgi:regulator of sigma E protease
MEIIGQILSSAWGIVAAIVLLGLCILFHEAGHFLVAKWCHMRVDRFSLGFGPPIVGFTRGETYYSINVFPIGGYVMIAGMEPGEEAVEGGFHSRPRWMGALTILAGVSMNMVLAVLLYAVVAYAQGAPRPGASGTLISNIFAGTPASRSELHSGDEIVALDGERHGMSIVKVAPNSPASRWGLKVGDRLLQVGSDLIAVPSELAARLAVGEKAKLQLAWIDSAATSIDNSVRQADVPGLPAAIATMTPEQADQFVTAKLGLTFGPLAQVDVVSYTSLRPEKTIQVTVLRQGQEATVPVSTEISDARIMKVNPQGQIDTPHAKIGRMGLALTTPTVPVSAPEAALAGVAESVNSVKTIIDTLHALINRKIAAAPGGPVSIIAMTYEQSKLGWKAVAAFGGFLSANLAVFNLLPLPPLDGFILLQLGVEGVLRRRIDARLEYLVKVAGVILLLGLVVMLSFNDVANLIMHGTP